ncbi:hypothetical protein FSP39_002690 [Pinctada imbricata]|uniref:Iron-sulfur cluster assembly 2 homolog, mitochondrial n=1 Tax=Pinctada imbricata TaxID=66713 RepID=A0AA88XV40_PINIB|nr:hypothetical protein FSP39_002690 [Pinctada imbricata]
MKFCFSRCQRWSQRKVLHSMSRLLSTQVTSPQSTPDDSVKLSDSCIKKLKELGETKSYLRVAVEGGGCSGFEYKFSIEDNMQDDDKIFERDGVKVIVDMDTLEFMKGSTIDYHEELIRSSFRVIDNPQAEQGCSCGASFSLK